MKKTIGISLAVILILVTALTACQPRRGGGVGGREVGAVVGGVGGGIAGSQFGSGSGKTAATIAGVLIGAAVGSYIGDYMTSQDRQYMGRALETNQPGQTSTWNNPNTGYNYRVTPASYYTGNNGRSCRQFTQTIYDNGQPQQVRGTACKNPQGQWEIVSTN